MFGGGKRISVNDTQKEEFHSNFANAGFCSRVVHWDSSNQVTEFQRQESLMMNINLHC